MVQHVTEGYDLELQAAYASIYRGHGLHISVATSKLMEVLEMHPGPQALYLRNQVKKFFRI